jgi:hypothetical protein
MSDRQVNRLPERPGQRDIRQRERSRPHGRSETPPAGALPRSRPRPVCFCGSCGRGADRIAPAAGLRARSHAARISDLRTAAADPGVWAVQASRPCPPRPKRGVIVSRFVLPKPEGSSSSSTPPRRCSASAAGMSACSPADRAKGPVPQAIAVPPTCSRRSPVRRLRGVAGPAPAPLVRLRPQRS